jgi:hypothetical protein
MNPEFYLVLTECDLSDSLANDVFEAGFDDCSLTMRGGKAAIWIRHREGVWTDVAREAVAQATKRGLAVSHIRVETSTFA